MKFKIGDSVLIKDPLIDFGSINLRHKGKVGRIKDIIDPSPKLDKHWGVLYSVQIDEEVLSCSYFEIELGSFSDNIRKPEDWL